MQPLPCAHPEEPALPILLGTRAFSWERWARGLNEPESLKNEGDNSHHLSAAADGNLMGKKRQCVWIHAYRGRMLMGLAAIHPITHRGTCSRHLHPSSSPWSFTVLPKQRRGPFTAEHFSKQIPVLVCIPSTSQLSLAFLSFPLTCKTW